MVNIFDYTITVDGIDHCGYCGKETTDCDCSDASKYKQLVSEAEYLLNHIPKLKYTKREKLVMGL